MINMGQVVMKNRLTFEEICDIVAPIALKHNVIRIYLFGSRAREDGGDDGDFDFCVDVPEGCTLMDLGSLMYHLEDALGAEVDLICESTLSDRPSFMEEVLHDRRIVFEA